jgi:ubiquinone/menaquinone biosynthesis C-methylase UbiE
MTTSENQPGTANTYVMPPDNAAEMARLIDQDKILTETMGSLFPGDLNISQVQTVLDVACGPGGWAREVAYSYPDIQVTGIDISKQMIDYANGFVRVEGLDNAHFQVMDATKPLEFPDASFDVVNARFMFGFLSRAAWPSVVKEFARVTRPEGRIILTESDKMGTSNSEACEKFGRLGYEAMRRSGLYADSPGLTPMLGQFLCDAGCTDIHLTPYVLDYSAGTSANITIYENFKVAFKLFQPFVVKMGVATQEELDALYDRAMADMLADNFRGLWYFLSADGRLA